MRALKPGIWSQWQLPCPGISTKSELGKMNDLIYVLIRMYSNFWTRHDNMAACQEQAIVRSGDPELNYWWYTYIRIKILTTASATPATNKNKLN